MSAAFDLVIHAGSVLCPRNGRQEGGVGIRAGKIAALRVERGAAAHRTLDFPDSLLLPGLIDLHAHPARFGSIFGVDPDRHMLARGTTTVLSQGDAGAHIFDAYARETIHGSKTRVRLALNISADGEAGPGGCCERLELLDVEKCAAAAERARPHVWGISVNASRNSCGSTDPREVLRRALEAAKEAGLPILYGMRCPEDWPLAGQLALLRPGDVVTYCFRRTPHSIVERGRVLPEIRDARARGVFFDVGHGRASFDCSVAEAAIGEGFVPDTISTDLQLGHVGETPAHDLPLVMSKLRAAGMVEADVFAAVTSNAAEILGLTSRIGSLHSGHCADLSILSWNDQRETLRDTSRQTRMGGRWHSVATIREGELVEPAGT